MKYIYVYLFVTIMCNAVANAQDFYETDSITISASRSKTDSLLIQDLNFMSSSYYSSRKTLERNYDYEIHNKQRKLKMWSKEVKLLGIVSTIGVCFGGPFLFSDASPWILLPVELAIGVGIMSGSLMLVNSLEKKAEAYNESSMSILKINSKSSLYITQYSTGWCQHAGLGIGCKYNF